MSERVGGRTSRAWSALAIAATAVAGLAVTVAAGGDPLDAPTGRTDPAGWAPWLALALMVALAVAVVVLGRDAPATGPLNRPRASLARALAAIALGAALAFLLRDPDLLDRAGQPPSSVDDAASEATASRDATGSMATKPLVALAGAAVVVLLAAGAVVARRRRQVASTPTTDGPDRPATAAALGASTAALDDPADPRSGVVAAYRTLLDALADAGAPRRSAEAPFEHVRRALNDLGVGADAIERLTALFAEARFSAHAITEQHRDAARAALARALDDLAGVPCA